MPLVWNRALSVGIAEIDQQQRETITRLRLLGDALGADRPQVATRAMADLVRCVARHFRTEERWMRDHDYPRVDLHARAHMLGIEALTRAERILLSAGPGGRFQELLVRSARWFDVHLRSEDLALGNFVRGASAGPVAPLRRRQPARAG
jgi:hemerythrin